MYSWEDLNQSLNHESNFAQPKLIGKIESDEPNRTFKVIHNAEYSKKPKNRTG